MLRANRSLLPSIMAAITYRSKFKNPAIFFTTKNLRANSPNRNRQVLTKHIATSTRHSIHNPNIPLYPINIQASALQLPSMQSLGIFFNTRSILLVIPGNPVQCKGSKKCWLVHCLGYRLGNNIFSVNFNTEKIHA